MRQVVLDTETTGLDPEEGHRIIEIGCVELVNRRPSGRSFHQYICPERPVDEGAKAVHGLDDQFLADKPRFAEVAAEFVAFIEGAELVIHNAPFDLGFLDHELALMGHPQPRIAGFCTVLDTLALARRMHPGQRNSLDALCRRYEVDNSKRDLHGALLDARILADVYLAMTGGQAALSLGAGNGDGVGGEVAEAVLDRSGLELTVVPASAEEAAAHEAWLTWLEGETGEAPLWRRLAESD